MKQEYEMTLEKKNKEECNPKKTLLGIIANTLILDAETNHRYHDELEKVIGQLQLILDDMNAN